MREWWLSLCMFMVNITNRHLQRTAKCNFKFESRTYLAKWGLSPLLFESTQGKEAWVY